MTWSMVSHSVPPRRCLGRGPVLLTFGCFHTPTNAHRIRTWLLTAAYEEITIFQMCLRLHSRVNNKQATCREMFPVLRRMNWTGSSSVLFQAPLKIFKESWLKRTVKPNTLRLKPPNHGKKSVFGVTIWRRPLPFFNAAGAARHYGVSQF